MPGSLINIYTFSIPPPFLRTRQACDARRQSGTGRVFRVWCIWGVRNDTSESMRASRCICTRIEGEGSDHVLSFPSSKGMLRLPSCRVHPLSCYWICSKTFQIRPANASNAPCVYVRVCTIFDAERRGRTCSGMFCRVCSIEIFLGNFYWEEVNFCTFSVCDKENENADRITEFFLSLSPSLAHEMNTRFISRSSDVWATTNVYE